MNKFKQGDKVTFNTSAFNDIGFYRNTIYEIDKIIDNVRVVLTGYQKHLINKKYLELIKKTQ